MSTINSTTINSLLKRIYPNGVAISGVKNSKLLSLMKTDTKFTGEGKYTIVSIAPTAGASADFQTAYAKQGPTQERRFFMEHKTEYAIATITGKAMAKARGDKGAVIQVLKHSFDRAGYAFGRSLAQCVWGNGGGALGSSATASGTTITLTQRADAVRFELGHHIQFASDDGTGTSPAGLFDSTSLEVTGIDVKAGTITVSADLTTISGLTGTYRIFRAGDYGVKMTGIPGIMPAATVGGSDSFRGVNRSTYRNRLAGVYHEGSGGPKRDTLIDACAEGQLWGAYPTDCFVNPLDFRDIVKETEGKVWVDVETKMPGIGFKGLMLHSGSGDVTIHSEGDVPKGKFWIVDPGDFTLRTSGDCPQVLDDDDLGKLVRTQGADAYEFRLGAYGDIDCDNPGNGIVGTF